MRALKSQAQELQDDLIKLTDNMSDVRSQKVKFSRLAREKGEEIGKAVLTPWSCIVSGSGGGGSLCRVLGVGGHGVGFWGWGVMVSGSGGGGRGLGVRGGGHCHISLLCSEEMLAKVDTLRKSNKEMERNRRVVSVFTCTHLTCTHLTSHVLTSHVLTSPHMYSPHLTCTHLTCTHLS